MKKVDKFYSVQTGVIHDTTEEYKKLSVKYFKTEKEAQKNIDTLFKKCYPRGFNSSMTIASPKYNDLTTRLESFTTDALFHYSKHTLEFEA